MLLQQLLNFQWYNEPNAVFFLDNGMKVISNEETFFWQNKKLSISKDNGHFFFDKKQDTFSLSVKWDLTAKPALAESGLMIRADKENWAKTYFVWDNNGKNKVITSVTNLGISDLAEIELKYDESEIWFKADKKSDTIELSFSKNGKDFILLRRFAFINQINKFDIGAYICCPQKTDFEAVLSHIEAT